MNTKLYDYMGSVYHCGAEIQTRPGDGWEFMGASVKETDDGEGKYLLVRWRREIPR